jgi:hypothetical protein
MRLLLSQIVLHKNDGNLVFVKQDLIKRFKIQMKKQNISSCIYFQTWTFVATM